MPRVLSKGEWIAKAKAIHGDKFDYSKVKYVNSKTRVLIVCPEHGGSEQIPSEHLRTNGCRDCGIEIGRIKNTLTTDEWIASAKAIHGDKYDYSETLYTNMGTKLKVSCPKHGSYKQYPQNHTQGVGCPFCGGEIRRIKSGMARRLTTAKWIAKAKAIHGDKYDYSETVYTIFRTKLKVTCPDHGPSFQWPSAHLKGSGCSDCGEEIGRKKRSLTTEEWTARAREKHGDKFDYSKVDYHNSQTNVTIICPTHGEFPQLPPVHIESHGCPNCGMEALADSNRTPVDDFIKASIGVHGVKYDYSLVEYVNNRTPILIGCEVHGFFSQRPDTHARRGHGCPKCVGRGLTTEEWIERLRQVHGERYDYSSFEYKAALTKSTIICKIHGEFHQQPSLHYSGRGCQKCANSANSLNSRRRSLGIDEFTRRGIEKFGDKFDYSRVEYANQSDPVEIICETHGPFFQTPYLHLRSIHGCRDCSSEAGSRVVYTTETWIARATEIHDGFYDYSKVEYVNSSKKVTVICPDHGEFKQVATNHVRGIGCWDCYKDRAGDLQRMPQEEVIEKCRSVHGDYYDYSKVEYVNNRESMTIICPIHGEFPQSFALHYYQRCGCSGCAKYGYDIHAPGYYYVHRILNEEGDIIFTKGGISNDPIRRFERWSRSIKSMPRHRNHQTVVVHRAWFENGQEAWELERILLAEENIRYPPVPGMDGGTELFRTDPLIYALNEWDYDLRIEA